MTGLLPCPFCGGRAALREDDGRFCVICVSTAEACFCCFGEGYDASAMPKHSFYNEEAAAAAWNTRATTARIAALEGALRRARAVVHDVAIATRNVGYDADLRAIEEALADAAIQSREDVSHG